MSFEYTDDLLRRALSEDIKKKETARREYRQNLPASWAPYEPTSQPLLGDWLAISVDFELQTPWFSKDDIPCHVFDNPLRRDRVFRAPFMSAASWKGLLRWAARMKTGLLGHLEKTKNEEANKNTLKDWKDSKEKEIVHLFGNERDEAEHFQRGALAFRSTWFDKVGFEVINPHDRAKKAGKNPIIYEVVPAGTTGVLNLLYAPAPGQAARDGTNSEAAVLLLLDAVEDLVTRYGFSAKRTSSWGLARITKASVRWRDGSCEGTLADVREAASKQMGGAA